MSWSLRRPDSSVQALAGKVVIGRGEEWNCFDKRVSRNHISLELDEDLGVEITTLGANPITLYPKLVPEELLLRKDESYHLQDGDKFSLIPGHEKFEILKGNGKHQQPKQSNNERKVEKLSFADIKRKAAETLGEQPVPNKKKKIEHNRNVDDGNMSEDEIGNFNIVERSNNDKSKNSNNISSSLNPWQTNNNNNNNVSNIGKNNQKKNYKIDNSEDGDSEENGKSLNPWKVNSNKSNKSNKFLSNHGDHDSEDDDGDDDFSISKKKKNTKSNTKNVPKSKISSNKVTSNNSNINKNYNWNKLSGMIISITGTLSRKRVDIIEDNGGTFHSAVTRNVTHLIVADTHKLTNKLEKAKNNGTKIVSEDSILKGLMKRSEAGLSRFDDDDDGIDDEMKGFIVGNDEEEEEVKPKKKKKPIVEDDEDEDDGDHDIFVSKNNNTKKNNADKHDMDDDNDHEDGDDDEVDKKEMKPKTVIEDGGSYTVPGSNYEIRYRGGVYYCTCVAWKMQNLSVDMRTCKHMRQVLGDEFETWRTGREGNKAAKVEKGNAPDVLLANSWEEKTDPKGWWMSEKLDGVRAYWNGKYFVSRNGNKFYAPDFFIKDLPSDWELDGELFTKRGEFNTTVSIVKSQDMGKRWKDLKYCVFDVPTFKDKPFEARMKLLNDKFPVGNDSYVVVVKQILCKGKDHLQEQLQKVEELKGEGLMLRQPGSLYVGKRSSTLLKVKTFSDCEAKVIGLIPGKGKFAGLMGALQCELASGITFQVGSGFSDKERNNPPPKGSIITVKYQELTPGGVPRFPSYIGIRIDAVWPPKK